MLKNNSVISINDLSDEDLNLIFNTADSMAGNLKNGSQIKTMSGRIMATLFFEPSTRTRLSFESAMQRLGGSVISMADSKSSSTAKGETLADTTRMVSSYSDIIVVRHPLEGAARLVQKFSSRPVINAGDGSGEHPTQTLVDLYTIKKSFGDINNLEISIIGDLRYGRTVHSLLLALSRYNVRINLVSPDLLRLPGHVMSRLKNIKINEYNDLNNVIESSDVFYVTRIQRERFTDKNDYNKVIGTYGITEKDTEKMKENAIIMHPLPRVDEISSSVDNTKNAKYFIQAANGIPVRMALISLILGD
ncbi:aspartate carbamoyltransferase [Picrophilus oshimae]|uniref:Aspartate carbamoyltransferase catalytic subunit n=2 Tax=Picrophilus torridus (strain ATCC 700027 / DSM 9790 / JCM 10055 / NBRC 100828 / KAW 2/3) TaxID=1122961 RepID=PYRB_PICTO|nr:aspartate carbamoyltransferase [Picrophilus oshimae]Q6L0F2.1 RecName: Full=Aspartate carbamoyltransferase catalytic subunit; AltName: Full=Aspartate transcarbamylase; Short=ATCase [Picrophilus oshimae DSM 9789]AAT43550.1 aspartate carbamoyltransferase [Picrophilus oshimae DSM 9789]SMD31174.1 aspartate carbamoyltransferase [Picrophilus oshimae DSM 9789]